MTDVLIRREEFRCRHSDTGRMPCDDRMLCDGRNRSDTAASQGTSRMDIHHQKLERGKEAFYLDYKRKHRVMEHGPTDNLTLDFCPQEQ